MTTPGQSGGPSSDAWGKSLTAPQLVSHQGLLLAFAREVGCPTHTLYFQVLDPTQSSDASADPVWNGWYRSALPGAPASQPAGADWQREQPAAELRLAGMDLLTVTGSATSVAPADASFQITSDGQYLVLARPSASGSVYLNRLLTQGWSEDVGGVEYARYGLEVAWEVRYQRSGLRDVPLSDTDTLSALDLTGAPFLEPTIELGRVSGAADGAFALTRVSTADPSTVRWYVACSAPSGVRLFSFAQTDDTVTDFTESPVAYSPLLPSHAGTPLPPIAGLAPALVMYAEQDPSPDPAGNQVEVQRAARLMLAVAVSGAGLASGLDRATAVYDFGLDQSGLVPALTPAQQAVTLVDGSIVNRAFVPDLVSPGFPTPAQAPGVIHVVDGLVVSGLLLGQLQPHTDLSARMAEDGLVHLYCGGPPASLDEALTGWRSLVPGEPQAMVAQFDPRVSRMTVTVPWAYAAPAEQGPGNVRFVARQAGPVMTGSTVAVSDAKLGVGADAQPQPDLCDVTISYPEVTGMGAETWHGVPREVAAFAAVLDGAATDDSADPEALNGSKPFFDFAGKHRLARLPIPPQQLVGFAPVATVVSTRAAIALKQVEVTRTGAKTQLTMTFTPTTGLPIVAIWPGLPTVVDAWADILAGSAARNTYPYACGNGSTQLYGLATDAYQIDAPVLFSPLRSGKTLTFEVKASATGGLDVTITGGPNPVAIKNVPSAVADFAAKVAADAGFGELGLAIDIDGVAGDVLPTPGPVGPMDLRALCSLFDVLMPDEDVTGCSVPPAVYSAGTQQHLPASGPAGDLVRLAGFVCVPELPDAGIPAYVQNRAAEHTAAGVNRLLHGKTAAEPAVGGLWVRETAPVACSFTGSDNVTVPVVSNGAVTPASLNLRPQWDWTLEAWVQPSSSDTQRVITFHDALSKQPATAPALDYQISLKGQDVIQFGSYVTGQSDSSYFQSGSSAAAEFLRPGAFSWECWIQPQATATSGAGALGGIVGVQAPHQSVAAFSIAVNANRHIVLRLSPDGSDSKDLVGASAVPAVNSGGLPMWTHVAVVAAQQPSGAWTLLLYLNARLDSTFANVTLQQDLVGTFLIIGSNVPGTGDTSMFGKMASLRFWAEARTAAEVRRTAFASLVGTEAGLLGCWAMTKLYPGGPTTSYLQNTAVVTGSDWDAATYDFKQPVAAVQDDYFLALVASVAGLPPVEAHAVLPNDRWNHLAVVFEGGGALELNPPARFQAGQLDWARASGSNLNPGSVFAVDAWVRLPSATAQNATILSHWAWDDAPEDQCFQLAIDPAGNLVLTVNLIDTNLGATKADSVTSSGINLADGKVRHVAAVFAGVPAENKTGATATYTMTLYADGKPIGSKKGAVVATTVQLVTSQTDVLIGRTNLAPAGADQAVESFGLFCGALGQLRFWTAAPTLRDLFPEKEPLRPHFSGPRGLAATWTFRDQQGVVAVDSIGGADAILTSSAPWSSLRDTSTLRFLANGSPVSSVVPYDGPMALAGASTSQFSFGAPVEAGVKGLLGNLGQVCLWGVARDLATIRGQQFTPRTGDEAGLLACWNFTDRGADLTGSGNNPSPKIDPGRIKAADLPVTNEGALVRNVYGGVITDLSASTTGRIAVGSYTEPTGAGTRAARAVLRRQYVLDPNAALGRPIDVGLLDLIYVGQVQTDPILIGYIEGAPPVPSENLSRPYYLSQTGAAYTGYTGASSVTLTQQSSKKVSYSSSTTTTTDIDFKAALGVFGVDSAAATWIPWISKTIYDLKNTVQAVATAKATYGDTQATDLSGEWTSGQRDTIALKGDWEPFQSDPERYLNPQVGRRFQPANLGYALVESLTADLFAMVYHGTGAAVGTMIIPNPAIPPDRNLLLFPMNAQYTKNGTLDGKVGLVNDSVLGDADERRRSYFKPAEAYALAASIDARNQRRQAYAAQYDWKARGQQGRASLSDAKANLPIDFESEPASGNQIAVPATGIANRYVWSADKGLHVETQGFASVSSRSYSGWRNRGGGGGLKAQGEFFFLFFGFAYSLDLVVSHMVDVHVGLKTDNQQSVSLDVTADGEAYLPAWNPAADAVYGGGKGAFSAGLGPGKVQQYRFFSFLLPASRDNADHFDSIVDPIWKKFSNDPTARALRELSTPNPVWRVLHRVTYVERVPPPLATRPVYTSASPIAEPANLAGNTELLALITGLIKTLNPTSAQVGAAVATALNPAPTAPGVYPESLLEKTVPWWRAFLDAARPVAGGPAPHPEAAALLTALITRVVRYVVAGYRTSVLGVKPPS
ncbi:MAG: LamG-like jellyroll fold domain-containing protein [Jatrophihabitantaceae bacterium]